MSSKKGAAKKAQQLDPAVVKVHQSLQSTVALFMSTVGSLCRGYDAKLQAAMPFNPKAKFFADDGDDATSPKTSPLLKRQPSLTAHVPQPTSPTKKATKEEITDITRANPELVKQLRILKGEARSLAKMLDRIHDWIALNLPTMDDNEDQRLEVVGMVLESVEQVTETLQEVYGLEKGYLDDRAEAEAVVLRHPESTSAVATITTIDSNMWDALERGYRVMIRGSLLLHSTLAKNMRSLRFDVPEAEFSHLHI